MHIPVLFKESIDSLHIKKDGVYVDGTLGGASHALAIVEQLGPDGIFIGLDLDSQAIKRAQEKLSQSSCRVILVKDNFRNIAKILTDNDIEYVDGIFLDLGWSSFQIADPKRGISFQENGPLTMTLNDVSN